MYLNINIYCFLAHYHHGFHSELPYRLYIIWFIYFSHFPIQTAMNYLIWGFEICFPIVLHMIQFDVHDHSDQIGSDQSLSCVRLFATPWIAARQASMSITKSRSSLRLMSIESVMPSSHFILCCPFSSCPQSLPASESFPMSQLFTWGGQSTRVSALASFLPKKSQGWSPSEWTGWISLQPKGLSRVFSNTTVQKHQFLGAQPSSQSNSPIHTWPQEKP